MKSKILILFAVIFFTAPGMFAQTLDLPPRPANALTGTQFSAALLSISESTREYWVLNQVLLGNVPNWMRSLAPVTITKTISGVSHTVTYYALPDYLSIGSDNDYFQEPTSPILAQHIANLLQCTLPTRLMVDQIWTNSAVKMTYNPFSPATYSIDTVPVFILESAANRSERNTFSQPLGALVSGDKKDIIISSLIYNNLTSGVPKPVVIYGWDQPPNGAYIQQPFNGHAETYMDYSHGVRLIQMNVLLDGATNTVTNILMSATLNSLLSDEGVIAAPYYTLDNTLTPFAITQPYSQSVKPGTNVQFAVTASGHPPFAYQWNLNGAAIPSATNATLSLTNLQAANAGTYTVVTSNSYGSVISIPAILKVNTNAFPILFSDSFANDTSASWSFFNATADYTTNWAYDFNTNVYTWNSSAYFIPPSPSLIGGPTRAIKFTVNDSSSNITGVNIYPRGQSFSNNFALKFDMWINYPGGAMGSGATGTTEYALCGINHTGTEVNWAATNNNVAETDGLWFAVDGEGGANLDYEAYVGNPSGKQTQLTGTNSGLVASFHGSAPFPTLFPANRFETVGAPGKNWVAGEIDQSNSVVTWKLDGMVIAQRANTSSYTAGDIMLGYMDIFSSVANPLASAFILFSNVRVEDWSSAPVASPTITIQPQSQTVSSGSNVVLSATPAGTAPISSQWYFNGMSIINATNTSLSLPAIQATNAGQYSVVFSNAAGSISSAAAQITVTNQPFQFNSAALLTNGSVQLNFTGAIGNSYTLQASSNLVNWISLGTISISANPTIFVDTNSLLFTNRFYRLMLGP